MENPTIILINGNEIKNNDVVVHLKVNGDYKNSLQHLLIQKSIEIFAKTKNIEVTDDELQDFVNEKRSDLNLLTTESTRKYLSNLGINEDQWIDSLEFEKLEEKVKSLVITEEKIELYFKENSHLFTEIATYKISVSDKNEADEIYMEAKNDGKNFRELAFKYNENIDLKLSSGFTGWIKRGVLLLNIENKIFTAEEGDIFGPFQENKSYCIYYVSRIKKALLSDELKKEIKDNMYNLWKQNLLHSMRIETPKNN
jgi:parvulin-like peptidyl-prolyl isomerase